MQLVTDAAAGFVNIPRKTQGHIIAAIEHTQRIALRAAIVDKYLSQIGKGEIGGNNMGPNVARYAAIANSKDGVSWCAHFVNWCVWSACEDLGLPRPWKPSGGARKTGKRMGAYGSYVTTPEAGDTVVWDRGKIPWHAHIGFVHKYDPATDTLVTVEGNKGKFPAPIREIVYEGGRWRHKHEFFASVVGPSFWEGSL